MGEGGGRTIEKGVMRVGEDSFLGGWGWEGHGVEGGRGETKLIVNSFLVFQTEEDNELKKNRSVFFLFLSFMHFGIREDITH